VLLLTKFMMAHSLVGDRESRSPRDGLEVWKEAV
jgi:hypothetical protein